jgi:sensor histidine kinase YesM
MMLQPILENAILHGIVPSSLPGSIIIHFSNALNYINIQINDNGIGIKNSQKIKQSELHKSRGMELINKRITALNQFSSLPITIEQSPITESPTNPGNKTVIRIPIDLYKNWLTKQNSLPQ